MHPVLSVLLTFSLFLDRLPSSVGQFAGTGQCPTGAPFLGSCYEGCRAGSLCFREEGCCPLTTCPDGRTADSFCHSGCSGFCYQGCCCDGEMPHGYGLGTPMTPLGHQGINGYPQVNPGYSGFGYGGYGNQAGLIGAPQSSIISGGGSCPTGTAPHGLCGRGCAPGHSCFQGRCCPLITCPQGNTATGFCSPAVNCHGQCVRGCCCPSIGGPIEGEYGPVMRPPIAGLGPMPAVGVYPYNQISHGNQYNVRCPTGAIGSLACSNGCGTGTSCYSGVCCPLATCPGGTYAIGFCGSENDCHGTCHQGCCCPGRSAGTGHYSGSGSMFPNSVGLQTVLRVSCPTGVSSNTPCQSGCGGHSDCHQGACCPLATCPGGNRASGFCSQESSCGGSCYQGCCCPAMSRSMEYGRGPVGYGRGPMGYGGENIGYMGGGPMAPYSGHGGMGPTMAGSMMGGVRCPMSDVIGRPGCGEGCGIGFTCFYGACCPLPRCPQGEMATGFCGDSMGLHCEGACFQGCCCPETEIPHPGFGERPMILPPKGSRLSIITSNRGHQHQCGPGSSMGRPCFNAAMCPGGACNQGRCCIPPQPVPITHIAQPNPMQPYPGMACSNLGMDRYQGGHMGQPQCGQGAQCVDNCCQCSPGFACNGRDCVPAEPRYCNYNPRPCFGFGCKRRRPLHDEESVEVENTFENVTRHCTHDCTCAPNELCAEGVCMKRLAPGQQGCVLDRQCSFDCKTARCHRPSGYCICGHGELAFLEMGLCFQNCPDGTTETDDQRCQRTPDAEALFTDKSFAEEIERQNTCGEVAVKQCGQRSTS